ncbi:MAG TPA: aldolase/citrate lyase family protein [Thermoplasmata archaeon]|jgi:2-keto-3-deoxy-L-rhamnonate aldolase RhmA|nr:aldolase/citrate lyase family protein [Thermoplasmata archaeon]
METSLKVRLHDASVRSFGTWISSASVVAVDALRDLGFDWFMIDTEHSPVNSETLAAMVAILSRGGPTPLVRVGDVDQYLIKQALDAGAHGILAPLVNSEAQARSAVSFAKYPPQGVRGAAAAAASRYGNQLGPYLRRANEETLVGVQIETRQALENLEAIAGVDGVDLLFVGPQDLTLSLGLVDARGDPRVREAMRQVVTACERHGKVPGTLVVNPEEKKTAVEMGFRFISLAADLRFLIQGAHDFLRA